MTSEPLTLPDPPRRVVSAGEGSMMLELEDRVGLVRKGSTIVEDVCIPEEKGERLLCAQSFRRCVMLGPGGALKAYDGGNAVQKQAGVLLEDDELVETISTGKDRFVALVGRMAGDELLVPTPEYRFVWIDAKLGLAGRPSDPMKRRPL